LPAEPETAVPPTQDLAPASETPPAKKPRSRGGRKPKATPVAAESVPEIPVAVSVAPVEAPAELLAKPAAKPARKPRTARSPRRKKADTAAV
jgi:ribonuclease E